MGSSATAINRLIRKPSSFIVQRHAHTTSPELSIQCQVGRGCVFRSVGSSSKSRRQRHRASKHASAEAVCIRVQALCPASSWQRQHTSGYALVETVCLREPLLRLGAVGKGKVRKDTRRERGRRGGCVPHNTSSPFCGPPAGNTLLSAEAVRLRAQFLHLGAISRIACIKEHAGRGHAHRNTGPLSMSRRQR